MSEPEPNDFIIRNLPRPTHLLGHIPVRVRIRVRFNPNIFFDMADAENTPPTPPQSAERVYDPLDGYSVNSTVILRLRSDRRFLCMHVSRRLHVCTHPASYVIAGRPVCTRHRASAQSRQSNGRRWYAIPDEVAQSGAVDTQPRGADGVYLPRVPAAPRVLVDLTATTRSEAPPSTEDPLFGETSPRGVAEILSWWDMQHIPNVVLTFAAALLHAQALPSGPVSPAEELDCSICMGSIDPSERRFTTRCQPVQHHFHACCIAEMCVTQAADRDYPVDPLHVTCPLCRSAIDDSVSDYRHALFSGKRWPGGVPAHWLYYLTHSLSPDDDFVTQVYLVDSDPTTLAEVNLADVRRASRSFCEDLNDYRLGWEHVHSRLVRDGRDGSISSDGDDDDETHPVVARRRLLGPVSLAAPPPPPTSDADGDAEPRTPPATLPGVPPGFEERRTVVPPTPAAPARPPAPDRSQRDPADQTVMRLAVGDSVPPARGLTVSYQDYAGTVTTPRTADSRLAHITFPLDHILIGLQTNPIYFMSHQSAISNMTPANLIATRDPQRMISAVTTTTTVATGAAIPDWMRGITVTLCMPVVPLDQV